MKAMDGKNDIEERDFLEKYAPHACCMAFMFSAVIMGLCFYWIYKMILMLL